MILCHCCLLFPIHSVRQSGVGLVSLIVGCYFWFSRFVFTGRFEIDEDSAGLSSLPPQLVIMQLIISVSWLSGEPLIVISCRWDWPSRIIRTPLAFSGIRQFGLRGLCGIFVGWRERTMNCGLDSLPFSRTREGFLSLKSTQQLRV